MRCFVHFRFHMCLAPQRRALLRHLNFQKWSENGVLCTFWLANVLRATTACNFSSLIWPDGSAPNSRGDNGVKRDPSQSSAISATPATQSEDRCRQLPRLPHRMEVDACKCHACHTKSRGDKREPSAPPEPAQCHKRHACHTKWRSMSPSATPATQTAVWVSCVSESCVWASCVWVFFFCVCVLYVGELCVRVLELCVGEACVRVLCVCESVCVICVCVSCVCCVCVSKLCVCV